MALIFIFGEKKKFTYTLLGPWEFLKNNRICPLTPHLERWYQNTKVFYSTVHMINGIMRKQAILSSAIC